MKGLTVVDFSRLTGSSATSETYGNSCLAHTEDFEVKEVEVVSQLYLCVCLHACAFCVLPCLCLYMYILVPVRAVCLHLAM